MKDYKKLKEIIQTANPEIMEPKLGCILRPHHNSIDDKRHKKTKLKDVETIIKVEKYRGLGGRDALCIHTIGTAMGFSYEYTDKNEKRKRSHHTDGYCEILGRPICLNDIRLMLLKEYLKRGKPKQWKEVFMEVCSMWTDDDNLDNNVNAQQFLINLLVTAKP